MNEIIENQINSLVTHDALWVGIAAAFVFFMHAGFKCPEVGLVRSHQITKVAKKYRRWKR